MHLFGAKCTKIRGGALVLPWKRQEISNLAGKKGKDNNNYYCCVCVSADHPYSQPEG